MPFSVYPFRDVDESVNTVKIKPERLRRISQRMFRHRAASRLNRLKQECDIPVFHDDPAWNDSVVLAAMINLR